jgi:hypothetical protein
MEFTWDHYCFPMIDHGVLHRLSSVALLRFEHILFGFLHELIRACRVALVSSWKATYLTHFLNWRAVAHLSRGFCWRPVGHLAMTRVAVEIPSRTLFTARNQIHSTNL